VLGSDRPASGARSKTRQRTGGRSGLPWPVVRVSGCGQQGERRAVLGDDRRQAVSGRRRGSALAASRACRGLVRISGCGQQGERRAVLGGDRRQAVPGRRRGSALAADRACRGLVRVSGCGQAVVAAGVVSVGQCSVAIGWQAVPGRRRGSALAASRACRGLVRVSGCWPWCSVTGSSSGSSFSRLMKPAERRRRRQRRAVLGDDRRQAVPGRRRGSALATGRACRGLVRVSGCWQAAVAVVWSVLAVLDGDRPASGARSKARQRTGGRSGLPCLVRVSGCGPWCSVTGSSSGSSFSRLVKPAERRRRRQCRAVLGGDRLASGARSKTRQRTGGRSGLPWPGQDLGLRAARRASGGAWWRSPASGARSKTRQRTGGRSGLPWPGQDLGLRAARRASGGAWWRSPASGARPKTRQRTGGRSGLLWPGQDLGLRAGSGCRWRGQCRAVLGGDRLASGARSKARQRTGSQSGLPWPSQGVGLLAVVLSYRQFVRVFVLSIGEACREATTAPASCSAR
jgi:hypothetical protein